MFVMRRNITKKDYQMTEKCHIININLHINLSSSKEFVDDDFIKN